MEATKAAGWHGWLHRERSARRSVTDAYRQMHERGLERAHKRMRYLANKMSDGQVTDFHAYYKMVHKKDSSAVQQNTS